ncbi:MAG: hypothetical protein AAF581_07845 [Planctomycetota bacterium]
MREQDQDPHLTPLTPTSWDQLKSIVARAMALDSSDRKRFIEDECFDNRILRDQALQLLEGMDDFLDDGIAPQLLHDLNRHDRHPRDGARPPRTQGDSA